MKFPFKLPEARMFDVVGFGTNSVDHLIRVPRFPDHGSKVELSSHTRSAGGEVASTLTGLQRLALKTAYAGRFGLDENGDFGLSSLVDEGVDVRYAEKVQGAATQTAFILIDDRTGERTVVWHRDLRLNYSETLPPSAIATLGRVLHLTPHDTAACIDLASIARSAGVIVSIDIDSVPDGVEDLLPLVDVCIASTDFTSRWSGESDPVKALDAVRSHFGCAVIGLTLGSEGSVFLCDDELIRTLGRAVPGGCVDTTGAGDAFRAGFLYGMLTGESVEESAILANAVAALKCRGAGARSALPTRAELDLFLQTHKW